MADKCFCTEVSSWHDILLLSSKLYDIVILYWCEPTTDDVAIAGVVEVSLYKWIARSLVSHRFSGDEKTRSLTWHLRSSGQRLASDLFR